MKIQKFVAPTTKEALSQVREVLGENAVILSNKDTPEGVEILASADPLGDEQFSHSNEAVEFKADQSDAYKSTTKNSEINNLMAEIKAMRGSLEAQLQSIGKLEHQDKTGAFFLFQFLLSKGFSADLSRYISKHLPENLDKEQSIEWAKKAISFNLKTLEDEATLLANGGIFALVGPTGVGKTTTTAKLAARFVLRHGADNLALINTDSYRIGAPEQVKIYGKILGVSVYTVRDENDLKQTLDALKNKLCIIIDTMGMSQRDQQIAEQIAMLSRSGQPVKRVLCLNTTNSIETLNEVAESYSISKLSGCILTKLDEAVTISHSIDVVLRHKLSVFYTAVGQRVPEDLELANSSALLDRAFSYEPLRSPQRLKAQELSLILNLD